MATKTFEVQHPESHYPTDEQMTSELRSVLKDDGSEAPRFSRVLPGRVDQRQPLEGAGDVRG